ncbi:hypothetical protein SNOG_14108 [Parastagonospora nodorum SN15]|uniref:Branched-chain amino acid aminotransferase n=1 Tax=Phaeosphaeria nodorum (strain SN15 / ATCC MYA-4574 / FGSC 10173) TaxID=321614 RepID=Q0U1U6_PHANO|nr:hypothetical protein SNOG_14108 [Parastagonospora nodorum SN15]EAT78345.1 hypothetical protein SNOG_14108 [Parastagonospora nodorum SN15]
MSPPSPKADFDWENFSPTKFIPVNGHIEARFSFSTGTWSAPTLVSGTDISISGLSPALNYGQQCYEGMKAFRTAGGRERIVIFRPEFHANRMAGSAASVCLPPPPQNLFLECVRKAVVENAEYVPPADSASSSFLYIRPRAVWIIYRPVGPVRRGDISGIRPTGEAPSWTKGHEGPRQR